MTSSRHELVYPFSWRGRQVKALTLAPITPDRAEKILATNRIASSRAAMVRAVSIACDVPLSMAARLHDVDLVGCGDMIAAAFEATKAELATALAERR